MGVNQPPTDEKNARPNSGQKMDGASGHGQAAQDQRGRDGADSGDMDGDGKSRPNVYSSNEGEDEQNDNQNLDASQGNNSSRG